MIIKSLKVLMSDLVRKETLDDREHYVCPVILITEGVHNNVLYQGDDIKESAKHWNGRPVPITHPTMRGKPISANSPEVLESCVVGTIFNAYYDEWESDGKQLKGLKAEAWIDIKKCEKIAPEVLKKLDDREVIEVSTGLFTDDDEKPGKWNEEAYDCIAGNYKPDHLALLPDGTGACSIADGAGMPRVNEQIKDNGGQGSGNFDHGGRPGEVGGSGGGGGLSSSKDSPAIGKMTETNKGWAIQAKDKNGKTTTAHIRHEKGVGYKVFVGGEEKTTAESLGDAEKEAKAILKGNSQKMKPAKGESKEDYVKRAMVSMEKELPDEKERKTAVLAMWNDRMKMNELSNDDVNKKLYELLQAQAKKLSPTVSFSGWIRSIYGDYFVFEVVNTSPTSASSYSYTNFKQGYKKGTGDTVELVGDPQAVELKTSWEPMKANEQSPTPHSGEGKGDKENSKGSNNSTKGATMNRVEQVNALITVNGAWSETDREFLMGLNDAQFAKVEQQVKANEAQAQEAKTLKTENETLKANASKAPATVEEYLAVAPEGIREVMSSGLKLHQSKKDALIKGITANERNTFTPEQLKAKSVDELQSLANLAAIEVEQPDFSGKGALKDNESSDAIPEMPAIDWSKK